MSTEAQKRASTNYNRKQDNIMIRPAKEEGAAIRAAAAKAGQSVQAYVLQAVRERMEREQAQQAAQPEDAQQNSRPSTLHTMRAIAASGRSVADIIREERAAAAAKAEADRAETQRGNIPISFPDSDDDIDKVDLPF